MRSIRLFVLSLLIVPQCLLLARPAPAQSGGPVIVSGHDADDHGFESVYAGLFDVILLNTTHGGAGILAIGADPGTKAAIWIQSVASLMASPQAVTFVNDASISTTSFSGYAVLYVPSLNTETLGGISSAENDLLIARAADVASFVNAGGGLFGQTQSVHPNAYGYLGQYATITSTPISYTDITATPEGRALGITDTNLDGCCWHNVFDSYPSFLDVLATAVDAGPHAGKPALLGGTDTVIILNQYEPGPKSCPLGAPGGSCCQSEPDSHALDPVYLFSGEFYLEEVDLRTRGRGFDFVWARKYRSKIGPDTELGHGWDWSYNIRLLQQGPDFVLCDGSSRRDLYTLNTGGTWTRAEFFREISIDPQGGYRLTFEDTSRWEFHAFGSGPQDGKIQASIDRNGNRLDFVYDGLGQLVTIQDTLGQLIQIGYDGQGRISTVTDWRNRELRYEYYASGEPGGSVGDLKSVRTPTVTSTPHSNDYPNGKTTVYTYSKGFADERLNHNLLTVTDPKGQTFVRNSYATTTNPNDLDFDRLVRQEWGDPGDLTDVVYVEQTPGPTNANAVIKAIVNDRVGNVEEHFYDDRNNLVLQRFHTGRADPDAPTTDTVNRPTGKLRLGDPAFFETRWEYNQDNLERRILHPNGGEEQFIYDEQNPDPRSRGNLIEHRRLPGPLGGDQAQISIFYEYDTGFGSCCGTNFVIKETDGRGHVTEHDYDASGNRIQTRFPISGIVADFEYNAYGQLTAVVYPDNGGGHRRRDEFIYHLWSGGEPYFLDRRVNDATGFALTTSFQYDPLGRLARITDPRGNYTRLQYNELDQIVFAEASPDRASSIEYISYLYYDANDNLARVDVQNVGDDGTVDPNNPFFTTIHDFDILNEVIRACSEKGNHDPAPNQLSCTGLPTGEYVTEEFEYDANRQQTLMRRGEAVNGNQPGNTVATEYDERQLLFRLIRGEGTVSQSSTQFDYDGNGNRITEHSGLEAGAHVTSTSFDGYDRAIAGVDPMGNSFELHYDANHNLVSLRIDGEAWDLPGSAGNKRLYEASLVHDELNRITSREVAHFSTNSGSPIGDGMATTLFSWTDASQIETITDDNGNPTTFAYDTALRTASITDALNNVRSFDYDSNSNRVSSVSLERSDLGSPDQFFTTTYAYDELDRLIRVMDSAGNPSHFAYDSRDNLTRQIDALGRERRWIFDGISRETASVLDMNGDGADVADTVDIILRRSWDDSHRLTEQQDDHGHATEYQYDELDRLVITLMADGTVDTASYDAHDNLLQSVDANGTVAANTYDELDRLESRAITPGANVSPQTTREDFNYDGLSRLVQADSSAGGVRREWDSMGNLTNDDQNGEAVASRFDGVGNKLFCTYPGGRLIAYTYDALNRKKRISNFPLPIIVDYDYYGPGRVQRKEYGNGTRTDYLYDGVDGVPNAPDDFGAKQIVSVRHTRISDGKVLDERSFTWNPVQHKTSRSDDRPGSPGWRHEYRYDAADRLIESRVRDGSGTLSRVARYDLDGVGNRTLTTKIEGRRRSGPGVASTGTKRYRMDAKLPEPADRQVNQYTKTPFGKRSYQRGGEVLATTSPSRNESYLHDFRSRLVFGSYTDGSGSGDMSFLMDALDRRHFRRNTSGSLQLRYYFDEWHEIEEVDDTHQTTEATWVHGVGIDEVIQMRRGGQDYYYHADDLQNVMLITDSTGQVVERYEYDDYGQPLDPLTLQSITGNPSSIGNPFLFTGRFYEPELGLYDYRTRHLDPRSGRFLERDRIGIWGDESALGNAFTYAANSPFTLRDPFGWAPPRVHDIRSKGSEAPHLLAEKAQREKEEKERGPRAMKIVVVFVDDFVTDVAADFQQSIFGHSHKVIRIRGSKKASTLENGEKKTVSKDCRSENIDEMVSKVLGSLDLKKGDSIASLQIAGHGYSGGFSGRLDVDDLKKKGNKFRKALSRLRPHFCKNNQGVTLLMCKTARGKRGQDFLKELAIIFQTKVKGWDNNYEIRPTGDEWTASPTDGGGAVIKKTGRTRRDSLLEQWEKQGMVERMQLGTWSGRLLLRLVGAI